MVFVAGGAADFASDLSIDASPLAAFEGPLHAAVFAGMKTQYSNPGAGIQAAGELAQKRVERGEFVIHSDPQGLENPADSEFAVLMVQAGQGGADGRGERRSGRKQAPG